MTPKAGDEVLFADGTTGTVKTYVRDRVLGYQDSREPRGYHEDEASVPLVGHVVEMAKPCRHEYVTLVTYLPSGFWQAVTTLAAVPAEQKAWDALDPAPALRTELTWARVALIYAGGLVTGAVLVWIILLAVGG